jgi:hypothetical protein
MPVVNSPLALRGFVTYDLASRIRAADDERYVALDALFDDLPEDPYARGSGRHRRYARGLILPWSGQFMWIPPSTENLRVGLNGYYQESHNPEHAGQVRYLPDIGEKARSNSLLLDLVMFDFQQTYWGEDDLAFPLHVGVHLVKLVADRDGAEAVTSPNELHQDGESFTFAHLIYRRNSEGGINIIAPPRFRGKQPEDVPHGERLAEFQLSSPLESYGVADKLVCHYVSPVRKGKGVGPGERAVVLTDFTPTRQIF